MGNEQCRQFLEGLPHFDLVVDHEPLVPILKDYAMDKLDNPRLLRPDAPGCRPRRQSGSDLSQDPS